MVQPVFGYGLSSIVFQEIRESKALAYSAYTYAANSQPAKTGGISCNRTSVHSPTNCTKPSPHSRKFWKICRFHCRKSKRPPSVLKQIAAGRITKADLYWTWRANRARGFANRDLRQSTYETLLHADADSLMHYQETKIKNRAYTWMVLGERNVLILRNLER